MQIRFLLGPAGSGKTFRCLAEIRAALRASLEGSPLVLLAPRQATFQLERQLLGGGALPGYTGLRILSFERLAGFVFEQIGKPVPRLLAENGRVMVLRALLERKRTELRVFRASARLPGFARELSALLQELQQYHLAPDRLDALADRVGDAGHLADKLHDLAFIVRAYTLWLDEHQLQDADRLLDLAADALHGDSAPREPRLHLGGLWMDGFAQLTPQERNLLTELAACADTATLAFCLENDPAQQPPWHSPWSAVAETFLRCRTELQSAPGARLSTEVLERFPARSRFHEQPALQALEAHWSTGRPAPAAAPVQSPVRNQTPPVRIVACLNAEAETEFAAREIRRYVREQNGRFRDIAVLLRSLDRYHEPVRRVFTRFEIPFFLDRREPVAHHPLAELTRCALRLAAFDWEHDDWFGALKTGLVHDDDAALDRLENEALARGWRGKSVWTAPPATANPEIDKWISRLQREIVPPFQRFSDALDAVQRSPTGAQLSAAIRQLWKTLGVGRRLERWTAATDESDSSRPAAPLHETVWDQLTEWLANLELAFPNESLPPAEWLTVVEAGLGQLSVGAIPPALDQVLVGAIDRSRNPDLRLAFVLGVNEGVFPAPPPAPVLLSRADREALASHDAPLGADHLRQIALERYYGYIACTRPSHQLILTCARKDDDGQELNPSPFIARVRQILPGIDVEESSSESEWRTAQHWSELIVPLLQNDPDASRSLRSVVPALETLAAKWAGAQHSPDEDRLPPELVERIYGLELRTSVSGLEDFAACPFKFFAGRGLRAEERFEFELDPREQGSFQHEVLKEFHLRLQAEGKRWRDVSPEDARQRVRAVGESLLPAFRDGLFLAGAGRRFTAGLLIENLEALVATLVTWARQYRFDPATVETSFGLGEGELPAWRLDLDGRHALVLRGRIDRIDLCPTGTGGEALAVVIDYKSSPRQLDPVLIQNGLELQLLAYLGALRQFNGLEAGAKISRLVPAGAFYVALRGGSRSAATRDDEQLGREAARLAACQHRGRFDGGHLDKFGSDADGGKGQFRCARNKNGSFAARGNDALDSGEFLALIRRVEDFLRQHGRDIYAGNVSIAPYRWRSETACDFCRYRSICRFDPWTQSYRTLRASKAAGAAPGAVAQPDLA